MNFRVVASDVGNNGADFRSAFIPLYASVAIATEGWTDPKIIAEKFGLKGKEREAVLEAAREILNVGERLTAKNLISKAREVVEQGGLFKTEGAKNRCVRSVEWAVESRGGFLDQQSEPLDVIDEVNGSFALIVDFSVDTNIEAQHRAASHILNQIRNHAIKRKDHGDFACIIVVEEAQYFSPEKGAEIKESSAQSDSKALMIEAISQAGGYNVGLIVITQRPAYVLKSCISQCNSVACFRLRCGNDKDAILGYTEYGSERLRDYLPGLADHEAMLWD